jgi:hypothetical protein
LSCGEQVVICWIVPEAGGLRRREEANSVILLPITLLTLVAVQFSLTGEALAQSRYCLALAEEAEAMEAEWVLENPIVLRPNEAILGAQYEFMPLMQIQRVSNPIPAQRELCRRVNTQLSKKAASLCYCRGGQSYKYVPFETLDSCEVRVDESTGRVYAYMAALVICM